MGTFPRILYKCHAFQIGIYLVILFLCNAKGAEVNIQAEKGATISLPCDINSAKCGDLHSIKWYRDMTRVYVFSHVANIARPEGNDASRMEVQYTPGSSESHLQIRHLEIADEALYKCEVTYIEVREGCDDTQFINLTTLVKPSDVHVLNAENKVLSNNTHLGPYNENMKLELLCEAESGKPVPSVVWYNGSNKVDAEYTQELSDENYGIGTGRSRLNIALGRGDLNAQYSCRVENDALSTPVVNSFLVDVNVRPSSINISGVEGHVVAGTMVVLQCNVFGARPAANVSWFNGSDPIISQEITNSVSLQSDLTSLTKSRLIFTATRFENGKTITCGADNSVMRDEVEPPIHRTITLEVLYPPIVSVAPANITVNESVDVLLLCNYEANPSSLIMTQWMRNGQNLNVKEESHYEGGTEENTALLIKNISREDMGEYSCTLQNSVGSQESDNVISLDVHFPPIVEVLMSPPSPVIENDLANVTLTCEIVSGNPDSLIAVRWYMDGELLKKLPQCNGTEEEKQLYCDDIVPSKLLLQNVVRQLAGNYSCEGMNQAGWGPPSDEVELLVYYPPGPAKLEYKPMRVIKKENVTLTCTVESFGEPQATKFRWYRGQHVVPDISTSEWAINPVSLETEANFTCIAYNEGGDSESDSVWIEVLAPPAFISKLPPYTGVLYSSRNVSITCRIECSPSCNITWYKDNRRLDLDNNNLYYVTYVTLPPDAKMNDFESVESSLIWNMTAWPNSQLDRLQDNANYTCESTTNGVGGSVASTTLFAVEYPPGNISLSNYTVDVVENHIPGKVFCTAKSHPDPTYQWFREGSNVTIDKGNKLMFTEPVTRRSAGLYACEAFNKHGNTTKSVYINVQYKPECQISQGVREGRAALVCSVEANPEDVHFIWRIKDDNDTIDYEYVHNDGLQSILTLNPDVEEFRTYLCFANNSVGLSIPCERDVTGTLVWWKRLSPDELLILVAALVALILCVIIICIIIIIVCRRKRANEKYNNPMELEEREKPEGESPPRESAPVVTTPASPSTSPPVNKWPLKPGVLVHVNPMHSLSLARLTSSLSSFSLSPQSTKTYTTAASYTSPTTTTTGLTSGLTKFTKSYGRKSSTGSACKSGSGCLIKESNFYRPSRASRLKRILTRGLTGSYLDDSFTERIRGSQVVTFKKLPHNASDEFSTVSRKRKLEDGPSQSSTADKNGLHPDTASDILADPDRGFYENLPFHGMQKPPNQLMPASSNHAIATFIHNAHATNTSQTCLLKNSRKPKNTHQPDKSDKSTERAFMKFSKHRDSLRRDASLDKYFTLLPKKTKTTTPIFYSMRVCRKHNKKAAVLTISNEMLQNIKDGNVGNKIIFCKTPPRNNQPNLARTEPSTSPKNESIYENLTDSIQILEKNIVEVERVLEPEKSQSPIPKPAPRKKPSDSEDGRIYANVSSSINGDGDKNDDQKDKDDDDVLATPLDTEIVPKIVNSSLKFKQMRPIAPQPDLIISSPHVKRSANQTSFRIHELIDSKSTNFSNNDDLSKILSPIRMSAKGRTKRNAAEMFCVVNKSIASKRINYLDDSGGFTTFKKHTEPPTPPPPIPFRTPVVTKLSDEPYYGQYSDLDYADVDYKYGPINYKDASIYAMMQKSAKTNKLEFPDNVR